MRKESYTEADVPRLHRRYLAEDDTEAGWEILQLYIPFLKRETKRHLDVYGLPIRHFDDLHADMLIGAFESLAGFKPELASFPTYLHWHLINISQVYAARVYGGQDIPLSAWKALREVRRVYRERSEVGEETTIEALAEASGMAVSRVRDLLPMLQAPLIDEPPLVSDEEGDRDFFDLVPSGAPTVEQMLITADRKARFYQAVGQLPQREQDIIYSRYPDTGLVGASLQEVGDRHDISGERVRQLEVRALAKVKKAMMGVRDRHLLPA